jgi:fructose-bisphosphate aldolase class I
MKLLSTFALLALLVGESNGFASPKKMSLRTASPSAMHMSLEKYADELKETAATLVRPGHGLLACDESTGTVGARLEGIGLENTEDNRRKWRELLFTTPNLGKYISGAILFEETLYQDGSGGAAFTDMLKDAGIIPGIKVDSGLKPLVGGGEGETWCSGLDGLYDKCVLHYAKGARFAKWRTALRIDTEKGFPTDLAIDEAAHGLSRYARICQEAGLVPIVEPEILLDGTHTIEETAKVQERVITIVYKKLQECGVLLEGTLLKPSMTVAGVDCEERPTPQDVARLTVQTFQRSIPPAMPGVTFLSGGLSEEDSSIFLNEINSIDRKGPWTLTFSFSRAMQSSCIKAWSGKDENVEKAQALLVGRAQANAEASEGKYVAGSQATTEGSLYVKNYVY